MPKFFIKYPFALLCLLFCLAWSAVMIKKESEMKKLRSLVTEEKKEDKIAMEILPIKVFKEEPELLPQNSATATDTKPCFFKGKVNHQFGPSTFNTIWISGMDDKNRRVMLKSLTTEKGEFQVNVRPGNYKVQVFGPKGVVAMQMFKMDCSDMLLPTINYEK